MRRARRAAGPEGALGLGLIALALLVLGALAGASFFLRAPPIDSETLCRPDAPPARHTIILVDSTDRLEPRHRRKLRAVLAQERARLSQYDRLTLMRLSVRTPQEPAILFSKCLPRPPEQTNPLFENARMAEARWDEDFASTLDAPFAAPRAPARKRPRPFSPACAPSRPTPISAPKSEPGASCSSRICWSIIHKDSHFTPRAPITPPGGSQAAPSRQIFPK